MNHTPRINILLTEEESTLFMNLAGWPKEAGYRVAGMANNPRVLRV